MKLIKVFSASLIVISLLGLSNIVLAQKKSPGTATALSVVLPGLGHAYTGEMNKAKFLGGAYLSAIAAVILLNPKCESLGDENLPGWEDIDTCTGQSPLIKPLWYTSIAVAAGTWLYAVLDAGPSAKRYNKRYSLLPIIEKDKYGVGVKLAASIHF